MKHSFYLVWEMRFSNWLAVTEWSALPRPLLRLGKGY